MQPFMMIFLILEVSFYLSNGMYYSTGHIKLFFAANLARLVVLLTPSFFIRELLWDFTVEILTYKYLAISLFVFPLKIYLNTSFSLKLRESKGLV